MRRGAHRWSVLLLALLASTAPSGLDATSAARPHITLDATKPVDGAVVTDPVTEIRLHFSGAPLLRGASVRLVTSGRSLVRTSPPAADPNDSKQLFVKIDPALPPGAYVVQWRCIADDGHVMRGDFTFEVAAS